MPRRRNASKNRQTHRHDPLNRTRASQKNQAQPQNYPIVPYRPPVQAHPQSFPIVPYQQSIQPPRSEASNIFYSRPRHHPEAPYMFRGPPRFERI